MPSLIEMPRPDYTPPMDRLAHRIARGPGGLLSSMYSSSSDTSEEGGSRGTGERYEPSVPLRPRILSDSSILKLLKGSSRYISRFKMKGEKKGGERVRGKHFDMVWNFCSASILFF